MKPEKVISTTEFVKWLNEYDLEPKTNFPDTLLNKYSIIVKYSKLMQTHLALSMFIPCDDKGEPIKKPEAFKTIRQGVVRHNDDFENEYEQYQQAKKSCIFKGWEKERNYIHVPSESYAVKKQETGWDYWDSHLGDEAILQTVEDLCRQVDLIPTKNFLNLVGL